ncbi:MAG: hypothetical protein WAM14_18425 [Candidatus Nitrosopolaris sp.]
MQTKTYTLAFSLAIGIGVMLATSGSVASVLAQNATGAGNSTTAAKNATANASGVAAKNATASASGVAAKNATASAGNATSNSSNPLAKIGKAISKLFGGK